MCGRWVLYQGTKRAIESARSSSLEKWSRYAHSRWIVPMNRSARGRLGPMSLGSGRAGGL